MARALVALALSAACAARQCAAAPAEPQQAAIAADDSTDGACEPGTQLLQVTSQARSTRSREPRDLIMTHVPYNFGHTIERVALLGPNSSSGLFGLAYTDALVPLPSFMTDASLRMMMQPKGEMWGRIDYRLNKISNVSGCPYAFTPPKYWPKELAAEYYGNKTVFGMLRDPYERMVAIFRGNVSKDYGGDFSEFLKTCDVNGAVKKMMTDYKNGGKFSSGCTYVPQSEFFEGQYGIKLPVDNRLFPDSFNKVMLEHGYDNIQVGNPDDIYHVGHCNEVWSAQLDCETRAMVQEVYAEDFKLLCEKFGYCDLSENTCIRGVEQMCPHDTTQTHTAC